MAGKIRHLVNRSGRYHARLVVPKNLREIVGKTELRTPLGADYRQALKLLHGAVAHLQHQIAQAELKAGQVRAHSGHARFPLTIDQIILSHYNQRLLFDEELRNDPRYASVSIDDLLVSRLREAMAGRASNDELDYLVGHEIRRFQSAGNISVEPGSDEWRSIARSLCFAEYEALSRAAERDEGDYSGLPTAPILINAMSLEVAAIPVSLTELWADYVETRIQAGYMRDGGRRQRPVIVSLRKFIKHNDASRLTKKDVMAWRDDLIKSLSAKTVNDIYLSTVKSMITWAVENDRLSKNVATGVRQPKARRIYGRERGYTDDEALKVLKASRSYMPRPNEFGRVRESEQMANVKRWVPIICAFTGARVSEIIQLRKEDVRNVEGMLVVRITPDAGTVKSGGYRDVPLHQQIINEGFAEFVQRAGPGPLFHKATDSKKFKRAAVIVSNKLSDWLRLSGLRPKGLQPNHAWRHRLKTTCRELAISDRVVDAIQGHAGKTAGDSYGDVTLKTKADAISRLPAYPLA